MDVPAYVGFLHTINQIHHEVFRALYVQWMQLQTSHAPSVALINNNLSSFYMNASSLYHADRCSSR